MGEVFALVRDYDFKESYEKHQRMQLEGDSTSPLDLAKMELQRTSDNLRNWCITHYADAFVAWVHIKAIRVFVESVLRYGLPVDFTSVLYKVHSGKDLQLTQKLDQSLGNGADDVDEGEEYHDFVLI